VLRQRHTIVSSSFSEFFIYSGKQGGGATVLGGGGHDIVVNRNRGNLRLLLSKYKHLRKSSCAAFCLHPFLQLGLCQLSLQII
jgi:hypothetical protein